MKKLIFRFNNRDSQSNFNNKEILGGKGANLAQMVKLGLPVPPGFTISTKACEYFYKGSKRIPKKIVTESKKEIKDYFMRDSLVMNIKQPLTCTSTTESYDISATVIGGGLSGQAGALRLGVSRALLFWRIGIGTPFHPAAIIYGDFARTCPMQSKCEKHANRYERPNCPR